MKNGSKKASPARRASKVQRSSGNVFADVGLPEPEAHLARAQLAQQICDAIVQRKLTQSQAATLLAIDQPKISALMRGKPSGFSTDRLLRYLNILGRDIEIVIRPAGGIATVPSIRVRTARRAS